MEWIETSEERGRAEKSGREPNTAKDALAKRSEEKLLKKLSKNFEKRLDKLQKMWYNKEVAAVKNDSEKRNKKQLAS